MQADVPDTPRPGLDAGPEGEPEADPDARRGSAPGVAGWWMLLIGAWSGDLGLRWIDVDGREDRATARELQAGPRRFVELGATDPPELSTLAPRELRRLPGIGPKRALAIVEARWRRDRALGPLAIDDVPGIGPRTLERIRTALEGSSGPRVGSEPGRGTTPVVEGDPWDHR